MKYKSQADREYRAFFALITMGLPITGFTSPGSAIGKFLILEGMFAGCVLGLLFLFSAAILADVVLNSQENEARHWDWIKNKRQWLYCGTGILLITGPFSLSYLNLLEYGNFWFYAVLAYVAARLTWRDQMAVQQSLGWTGG